MAYWDLSKDEADSNKKALIITIILNVLLLVAIYFIVVWRPQVPPIPQFGLELSLGFTDMGSGTTQTTAPPSESEVVRQEAPAPGEVTQQPTQPATPAPQPETKTAKPAPSQSQTTFETQSKVASPLKGGEKTTEANKESTAKAKSDQPVTQPQKAEDEKTVKQAEETPKIDQRAIFGAGGSTGSSQQQSAGSNQGTSNQRGDEGNPQGSVDGRALMQSGTGNAGSGAGYNLELAGWDFASKPNIKDQVSSRNGRIVFRITIDDSGKIVQAIPLEYNVSNDVLAYYRTVVNQLTFKRQSGNPSAEYSTGKITFVIQVD
ncbi:energy transducer TonB [Litoribacter ruber]|uniref:Energy transducer TonB n=1 Tax=Litoribacter ruber TaxID=702568 RepID=A0AAP2G505_9BACT|nr:MULTISPECIES: energy transducer TonB [Litoribacter]MBS9524586.1 energy transducer TonB [Litoribacter alkaliphilus]MBT0810254.1 energy transducer TonB [Litoribacter ruber]